MRESNDRTTLSFIGFVAVGDCAVKEEREAIDLASEGAGANEQDETTPLEQTPAMMNEGPMFPLSECRSATVSKFTWMDVK